MLFVLRNGDFSYFQGDIAFRLIRAMDADAARKKKRRPFLNAGAGVGPSESASDKRDVTVCDISQSMLEVGKTRALQADLHQRKRRILPSYSFCNFPMSFPIN